MPDPTSIIATIVAIKNSIDIVKAVKEADYDLDKAILKEKIVVLVDSLLEAKLQASETLELIEEKNKKIDELETLLNFKAKLVRKGEVYFDKEADKTFNEPYCSLCWESEGKPIHLNFKFEKEKSGSEAYGYTNLYYCPKCSTHYEYP